jgi:hypothetical protein
MITRQPIAEILQLNDRRQLKVGGSYDGCRLDSCVLTQDPDAAIEYLISWRWTLPSGNECLDTTTLADFEIVRFQT